MGGAAAWHPEASVILCDSRDGGWKCLTLFLREYVMLNADTHLVWLCWGVLGFVFGLVWRHRLSLVFWWAVCYGLYVRVLDTIYQSLIRVIMLYNRQFCGTCLILLQEVLFHYTELSDLVLILQILSGAHLTFLLWDYNDRGYFCATSLVNFPVIALEGSVLIMGRMSYFSQCRLIFPTPFLLAPKMRWCEEAAVRINHGLL